MSINPRIPTLVKLTVLSLVVAGCHRSPFTLAPVHGKVSVDDKPLIDGKIMFAPIAGPNQQNPGKPAFGTIQPSGDYRLTTFAKDDGAVVGEHWVTILNVGKLPKSVPEFEKITFPKKVKVDVGRDNEIEIKLTGEIVKKYHADNR